MRLTRRVRPVEPPRPTGHTGTPRRPRPPRLRTVLLLSNLAVLALPLAGLWALRLYESALVRQTEAELVAQAAVLAGAFREAMGLPPPPGDPGRAAAGALLVARRRGLDLAIDPVLPPPPEDAPAPPAEPDAAAAGRALTPVLRDAQAVTLASLRLTDRRGVIVATTGGDLGRGLAGWDEVARVLAGAPVVATLRRREPAKDVPGGISRTAGLRVFVALPVPDGAGGTAGAAVLSRTPSTLGQAAWGKSRELLGLSAALLCGGALLAAGISRLVTRPLLRVVAQAHAAAAGGTVGSLARPLARPGTREVEELSAAIAHMARMLERRAGYISGFAASVSHEFKTPLAAIRAAGELLEDHFDAASPEERRHLLGLVSDGAARLELLVRRLVDLARADMVRAGDAAAGTAVGPVLERVAAHSRTRGLAVETAAGTGAGAAWVALPEGALEALLTSLLDNAAVHAPGAAVRIGVERGNGRVYIEVRDDGPGIPPAHRERAFEPFFTTARDRGGTGLGLPIVRAIAAGVGGSVTLLPDAGVRGAAFRIELPAGAASGR